MESHISHVPNHQPDISLTIIHHYWTTINQIKTMVTNHQPDNLSICFKQEMTHQDPAAACTPKVKRKKRRMRRWFLFRFTRMARCEGPNGRRGGEHWQCWWGACVMLLSWKNLAQRWSKMMLKFVMPIGVWTCMPNAKLDSSKALEVCEPNPATTGATASEYSWATHTL